MVTVALFAMCGLLGLAVDFGWAFFVKKAAQAAADAAALAAATESLRTVGVNGTYVCGGNVPCSPAQCNATNTNNSDAFGVGCKYALRNGFTSGGKNGRQEVTIVAGTSPPPPTAPGVMSVYYWVTVRATEQIPQLFSSVLGNTLGTVSARATAAVAESVAPGTVYGLNRQYDPTPNSKNIMLGDYKTGKGMDFWLQGGPTVKSNGPVFLASNATIAADAGGSSSVRAPFTDIRGGLSLSGSSSWVQTPSTGVSDGENFYDPFEGKGQPPAPTITPILGTNVWPINGGSGATTPGLINGGTNCTTRKVLFPGFYYVQNPINGAATGAQMRIEGCVEFRGSTNFDDFVFFGGLSFGQGANVLFAPGRYVLAGATNSYPVLEVQNGTWLTDHTAAGVRNTDAGEIFILTDMNYLGTNQIPSAVASSNLNFAFGSTSIKTGEASNKNLINLHGLNDENGALPQGLKPFSPVVIWQDQRNSTVKHNSDGTIDTSCGDIDHPCLTGLSGDPDSARQLDINANVNVQLYGAVYQPRGAWVQIWAGSNESGPLQIVSGAYVVHSNGLLNLLGLPNPITTLGVVLVE
ncbi:MAG: pilus assembly protein TadG-related protein [Acidobacteriales bacterium]|nr:pilus assembly protein TadG-related protein [Terriglobales bacterium]